jgi:hypothetical protein
MAITWYSSAGQPSDSVGVAGDLNWDTTNRITWGPKTSSNTWAGTAYSNIGPTGPAMLSGTGAPGSGLGQIGNGYTDVATGNTYLKSSSGWALTGNILGPTGNTGAQGFSSLSNQATSFGGVVQSVSQTLTSTAQTMQNSGSTLPAYVSFPQASAFMGISAANNGVACVVSLVDTTTNTAVYTSSSIAANSNFTTGLLTSTTYPIVANRLYQWMVTGSGSSNIGINTFFLQPSVLTTAGTGILSGYFSPASSTLSSTVQYFYLGGTLNTSNAKTSAYTPLRAGGLMGATALYVPSAAGAASATATFTLYSYTQSGGATATVATFTATNTGVPQATQLGSIVALNTAVNYYVGVTGTGTGTVDIKFQLVV